MQMLMRSYEIWQDIFSLLISFSSWELSMMEQHYPALNQISLLQGLSLLRYSLEYFMEVNIIRIEKNGQKVILKL